METLPTNTMLVWTTFCLAGAALLLRLFLGGKSSTIDTSRLPPGPPGWPVLGNILDVGFRPHANAAALKRKYGPLVWLRLGSLNTLVISSAEAALEVFKHHDKSFYNRHLNETLKTRTAAGSLSLSVVGPYWRMQRRLIATELFSKKRLDETAAIRRKSVDQLLKWISIEAMENPGTGVEVARFIFAATFNLIGNLVLSRDLVMNPKASKARDFFNLTSEIMLLIAKPNVSDYFPFLRWLDPQGLKRKTEEANDLVRAIADSFVDERRRMGKDLDVKKQLNSNNNNKEKDFLDVLMEFEGNGKDEPPKIPEENLSTSILELFIGATEAINITVEWALAELLRKPEVMNKARAEITQIVGHDRKIEESDMVNLPYLRATIKETLRLHPPAPLMVPRTTMADTELMGYLIPKGTQVWVNTWEIGRDPSTWDDPLSFKPERFLGSNKKIDYRGQNFELIPFGAGRRICPGLPLAHQMLPFVLGSLLQSFEWVLENGVTPDTLDMGDKVRLTLRKNIALKAIPIIQMMHVSTQ